MTKLQPFAALYRYDNQSISCVESSGCYNAANYSTLTFGMERKGRKINKYWTYMKAVQSTGAKYWTKNFLHVEPFTADTELEAKDKLMAILDAHIQDLQEIRDSINNLPFKEDS